MWVAEDAIGGAAEDPKHCIAMTFSLPPGKEGPLLPYAVVNCQRCTHYCNCECTTGNLGSAQIFINGVSYGLLNKMNFQLLLQNDLDDEEQTTKAYGDRMGYLIITNLCDQYSFSLIFHVWQATLEDNFKFAKSDICKYKANPQKEFCIYRSVTFDEAIAFFGPKKRLELNVAYYHDLA